MAKKLGAIGELILSIAFPKVLEIGADKLTEWLNKAYSENPDLVKSCLVAAYPFIDVYLEKFVAETKTKLDDKTVAELKKALEDFADSIGLELPNLDDD